MFQVPAAVVSAGLIGCRGNAVECREKDLTGRDSDRYLSVYSPSVLADSEVLDQASSIIIPDNSRYFINVLVPVYPGHIRSLLGNFMTQDPYMFYVAFGHYTDLAGLDDLRLPEVEIVPKCHRVWRRDLVEAGPITKIQAAMASRLQESWGRSLLVKKEVV
ncbi:hypothetical protein FIBSPDRAFT_897323 [Athelia psychrophila]|uniref:Uncharacterized protein n=1 Tax=Athelia psychrophila TaxID=1759441 RepID=A0A166CDN3_9AGAM|nr:hypothetical protein FIBSPDRAFT_897323 [Fibularhizoctonia sp. CBS 109695]